MGGSPGGAGPGRALLDIRSRQSERGFGVGRLPGGRVRRAAINVSFLSNLSHFFWFLGSGRLSYIVDNELVRLYFCVSHRAGCATFIKILYRWPLSLGFVNTILGRSSGAARRAGAWFATPALARGGTATRIWWKLRGLARTAWPKPGSRPRRRCVGLADARRQPPIDIRSRLVMVFR